jgi:signal transduction histidine kinase
MKINLPFRPPDYGSNVENYQANLLYSLAWTWIITTTLLKIIEIAVVPANWLRGVVIIAWIGLASILCLILNQQKHTRLASIIFPLALWLLTTVFLYIGGGIRGSTFIPYIPTIVTSGFLLGVVSGSFMAGLCIISGLVILVLEMKGMLPVNTYYQSSLTIWLIFSRSVLQIIAIQYVVTGRIRTSFEIIAKETRERMDAQIQLEKAYENVRLLNAHVENIREAERAGIAREVHDELGQQLTSLKVEVSWLERKIPLDDALSKERITNIFMMIDDAITTIHRISSDLRPGPLEDLGLIDALEWQSMEFQKRTGISCSLKVNVTEYEFEKNISLAVFRIYQEALTNIVRHASASHVETSFNIDNDFLTLIVKDNGNGFDTTADRNKNSFGLLGMDERAHIINGHLDIESKKGKGTTVILKAPLFLKTYKPLE